MAKKLLSKNLGVDKELIEFGQKALAAEIARQMQSATDIFAAAAMNDEAKKRR